MKTITKYTFFALSISATLPLPSSVFALKMPSLTTVMQENAMQQEAKNTTKTLPKKETVPVSPVEPQKEEDLPRSFTYQAIKTDGNIHIFKAEESDIFVQKITLKGNNQIQSLLPDPTGFNKNTGEPQFERQNIQGLLKLAKQKPTSLISGQFFAGKMNPTELSLGLKSDNIVRSAGADNRGRTKKIITLINGQAKILDYSWENLDKRTGDFAIVGFGFSVPNRSKSRIGRNYLCLPDPSRRNTSHSLITLTAVEINEEEALQEMKKYNCTQKSILKLDGGGSARFWYNGTTTYGYSKNSPDKRTIPHGLAFYEE